MASTIPPIAAFDFSKRQIKNMPLEQINVRILDDINKLMWMAAPWRWTVGTMTPITLVTNTSDYTLTVPADFLYLIEAYIADGSSTPRHLDIMPKIPATMVVTGLPQFISYESGNLWRVSPKPGTLVAPTKQIVTFYKKIAPIITAANACTAGTLIFDDEHFPIYEAGVLWLSYLYADDQRAGTCNADSSGKMAWTGQRATFEAGLAQMRLAEPLPTFNLRMARDIKDTV